MLCSNHLLAELMNDRDGEGVRPDENMLEVNTLSFHIHTYIHDHRHIYTQVWVKGGTIKEGILSPGSSSFVVVVHIRYIHTYIHIHTVSHLKVSHTYILRYAHVGLFRLRVPDHLLDVG